MTESTSDKVTITMVTSTPNGDVTVDLEDPVLSREDDSNDLPQLTEPSQPLPDAADPETSQHSEETSTPSQSVDKKNKKYYPSISWPADAIPALVDIYSDPSIQQKFTAGKISHAHVWKRGVACQAYSEFSVGR